MTRSAWVTVRLPGARTAPPTSTRIWFQTGAVKHGRKTASQDSRIGGTVGWSVTDSMRFCVIESVESSRPRRARAARYIGRHRHATRHQIVASPNVNRNGRSDHSTYRVLPLLQGDLACGTSQPRLYALPCPVRRVGRTFASDRIGRQVRSALLVALEGPMGLDGPVRTHRPVNRRRTTLHRPRGYLLGYHLTAKRMKNAESRAKHISTSYAERQNLNFRMGMRRFTRLTNAFSKKAEAHYHMVCLYTVWHNFVRIHKTLRCTPAMAAGMSKTLWSMDDIVKLIDDAAP